ncbi:hypothetical protein ABT010_37710 [Streptomyces sp. NPDC002668]|uniref:hypothetical protein n=1 Tax=Streptomyces sp. NPDC002668 TaxID=3154422 RepID=UPI003320BD32
MANLALLYPIGAAVGATYAAAAWAWRRFKAAALDGVYPGSPQHQAALARVDQRTAPQFTYWPDLPTAMQAAHDERALDTDHPDTLSARNNLATYDDDATAVQQPNTATPTTAPDLLPSAAPPTQPL